MIKEILSVGLFICTVSVKADFTVLHSPDSVQFEGEDLINQSSLKEIFAGALGFTVKQKTAWNGIVLKEPFNVAKGIVVIVADGVDSLKIPGTISFPFKADESEETSWQTSRNMIEDRNKNNTSIRINLSDGHDALGQSALGELKPKDMEFPKDFEKEDGKKFIDEIKLMHAIAERIRSCTDVNLFKDTEVYLFWLVVSGLEPIYKNHKDDPKYMETAFDLLKNAIDDINKAFYECDGQVLVAAFGSHVSEIRETRSIALKRTIRDAADMGNATLNIPPKTMNLSDDCKDDFPVIFNIILWSCVIFFFSLYAVCITIAQMDPGRDSIIYRMTSNRMKKDN